MNTEATKIQKTIDAIKKDRPDYEQMLDLFGELIIKQSEFMGNAKVDPPAITKAAAQAKLKKGNPLLNKEDFQIDIANASRLFGELCEIFRSGDQELNDEVVKIDYALEEADLNLEDVFQSIISNPDRISEIAESLSLDGDVLLILAMYSIRPSLEANVSSVRDMVESVVWTRHTCPICGSSPAIAELRQVESTGAVEGATTEGAERILYCFFCRNEWRAERLSCVFCGNTDTESLGYFFTEEGNGYRIDTCEKCRKYIKTMDSRLISHEIIPPIDDFSTLHLDLIAQEEGYEREAWLMSFGVQPKNERKDNG